MLVRNVVLEPGGTQRTASFLDLVATNESVPATNTGTAVTLTGALLSRGMYLSSAASAPTLTLDSAANIVAALAPFFAYNPNAAVAGGSTIYTAIESGTSFRFRIIISTAFAVTVSSTANTGVTVNRGSVAASSSRDFLVTIVNGTPAQTVAGNTTNASAVVSGFTSDQLSRLSVGMVVTNAVANLQGQTIIGINQAAGTVTMSGNANATATGSAINFSPVVVVDGL
jgi:hypothetical protein